MSDLAEVYQWNTSLVLGHKRLVLLIYITIAQCSIDEKTSYSSAVWNANYVALFVSAECISED
jgi:hypothetical protein